MASQRRLKILAIGILAIAGLQAGPAPARECFEDGTAPICKGQCPRGYEEVDHNVHGCLTGRKVVCCEPYGMTSIPQRRPQAARCPAGLVWRERFEGDSVCVTPAERDANRRRRGL